MAQDFQSLIPSTTATPQPAPTPSAAPSATPMQYTPPWLSQPIDQQALTLAHSIALQESSTDGKNPNYSAIGDNGTSFGAYQWNGVGKFAEDAKQAGLDPNDPSPENQDKVAYYAVEQMKKSGLDPGQIASQWNSGSPNNWQNHSGSVVINGKQISYNTPAYVAGVQKFYNQLSAQSAQNTPATFTPFVDPTANTPAPQNTHGLNSGNGIGGWLTQQLTGPLTATASGLRAVEAAPKMVASLYDLATGNKAAAQKASDVAQSIQQERLLGVNTMAGNAIGGGIKGNIGAGIQDLGDALMVGGSPSLGVGSQTAGTDIAKGDSAKRTIAESLLSALFAKGIDAAAPAITSKVSSAYGLLPQVVQDMAAQAASKVSSGAGMLGDLINPTIDKVTPDIMQKSIAENLANSPIGSHYLSGLEDSYNDLFGSTKAANKGLLQSLAKGDDPAAFGAGGNPNGKAYIPDTVKTTSGATAVNSQPTIDKVMQDVKPFEQQFKSILDAMDKNPQTSDLTNLDDLGEQVKSNLDTARSRGAGTLPDQRAAVDAEINNLKQTYGDNVTRTQLNEIRSGQWSQSKSFNPNKPFMGDVNYGIGKAAKNTLMDKVSDTPVAEKLLDSIGDHYDFANNLKKVDGKVLGTQSIGKIANKVVGTLIGAHFGIPGEIMGNVIGGSVSDLLANAQIAAPIKKAILEAIPQDSALYDEAQSAIQQLVENNVTGQVATKALPAPAIAPPVPTDTSSMTVSNQARGLPTRNPATGRMVRTYTSEPEGLLQQLFKNKK